MLRSHAVIFALAAVRLEGLEFMERLGNGGLVEFAFQSKMVQSCRGTLGFELDESHQAGKEVVALDSNALGRGLGEGGIALETLVVLFDFPGR